MPTRRTEPDDAWRSKCDARLLIALAQAGYGSDGPTLPERQPEDGGAPRVAASFEFVKRPTKGERSVLETAGVAYGSGGVAMAVLSPAALIRCAELRCVRRVTQPVILKRLG